MAQDQRQDALPDGAETDDDQAAIELCVDRIIDQSNTLSSFPLLNDDATAPTVTGGSGRGFD
jgi:hypothetical protein